MVVDQSLNCVIRDVHTGQYISFTGEKPTGFTDSYSANYDSQSVRGRSSPFQSYNSSGPRTITFDIKLALDFNKNGLVDTVNRLRDMLKPYKVDVIRSPRVHVIIGEMLNIEAVPTSFNAVWSDGYKNGIYRVCTLSFSFTEVEDVSSFNKALQTEISSSTYPESSSNQVQNTSNSTTKPVIQYIDLSLGQMGYATIELAKRSLVEEVAEGTYIIAKKYSVVQQSGSFYKIVTNTGQYWVHPQSADLTVSTFTVSSGKTVYGYTSAHDAAFGLLSKNQKRYALSVGTYNISQVKIQGAHTVCMILTKDHSYLWVKE